MNGAEPPTAEQVAAVYRQALGREPDGWEIDAQLAAAPTLDALLRGVLDSEEHAARLRAAGHAPTPSTTIVNTFHPDLAEWGMRPGTRSEDGVAIVGHDGWLFLCGGTNSNLGQYLGEVQMAADWLDGWREVFSRREEETRALGVATAFLVVPDKLPVYRDRYPEELHPNGPRPVERLLDEGGLDVIYPAEEMRAAGAAGEALFLWTDTHLAFRGNEFLFASVAGRLGIERMPDLSSLPSRSYPINGDLGSRFEPQIISIVTEPGSLGSAEIREDNQEEIAAVQGHIGMRRVFRNEASPDPRTAVVFGDSFGNGVAHYQGLSWWMAQVFREVHFVWAPFGWDPDYVQRIGATAVLIQGAERFVGRVPHVRVEVARLTEETLRRKRAIGVESIFDG